MTNDPKINQAIIEAVEEADQSSALATKLIAWITAILSEGEDPNDKRSAWRHHELLFQETKVPSPMEDS